MRHDRLAGLSSLGKPMLVTGVKDQHVITELGDSCNGTIEVDCPVASQHERDLLQNGLLIGLVVDEQRDHFGRGDFWCDRCSVPIRPRA